MDKRKDGIEVQYFLAGTRVLIVEDEFLPGLMLEQDIEACGGQVVGPFRTVATAVEAVRREQFDLAVLDINLAGEMAYPVADELRLQTVPFILVTGYASGNIPEKYRQLPRISKPYETLTLLSELRRLLSERTSS